MSNAQLAAGAAEQRRERRFSCDHKIAIVSTGSSDNQGLHEVELLDCSVHGLGLLVNNPMEVGSQFIAKLKPERSLLVLYTVRHCVPVEQGRFKIGASFDAFFGTPATHDPQEILKILFDDLSTDHIG